MLTVLSSPSGPCLSLIYAIVEARKEIASIRQIEKRKERKFEEEEEDKRKGFLELLDMVSIAECKLNTIRRLCLVQLLAFIVSPDNHQIIIEKKDDGPGIQANETPVSTQLTFTEHNYETVASEGQFPLSEKTIVDSPPHKLSDLLHFPHRPLSPSVSRLTPIMLSKNSHSPQPEPIKRTASHKSAANAINLSHFPVKLSQVTQDSLDDNSSWKRPPVERTKVIGNSSKTPYSAVSSTSNSRRPPPLIIPFQRSGSVDSNISPSRIITFFDLPSFSYERQRKRDQESSLSRYSQSSASSFSSIDNNGTVQSDRLASELLAQADSRRMPLHHDTRDEVDY